MLHFFLPKIAAREWNRDPGFLEMGMFCDLDVKKGRYMYELLTTTKETYLALVHVNGHGSHFKNNYAAK